MKKWIIKSLFSQITIGADPFLYLSVGVNQAIPHFFAPFLSDPYLPVGAKQSVPLFFVITGKFLKA
ncbi:hypothetical protein [Bacillus sp. V2I10]|uniref:hypothetical protein n=1 Tax=Bacillus sp. V2I10 TaxID=3042276 RepID=UPI0027889F94|nr:hypothetical protein [Bacillus sp. V2I10]MDQ0860207.1 hypothetical protein [Bacillus sp. V2I10]